MATITSNGTGGGLWSATTTWVGGVVPIDNDTVVIASGDTVTYDADWSNATTYPNGLNDMTITGTLNVSTLASSYMKIKAAKSIKGAGTFNIGTSGAGAIPFAVKFTLTGGSGWNIVGDNGLTLNIYGTEPANQWVRLSADEAINQTELSVDTDITGETNYWKSGDEVVVCSRAASTNSQFMTIASTTSNTITMTAGLTVAKNGRDVIALASRNVQIIFDGASGTNFQNFSAGKLNIGSGRMVCQGSYAFGGCYVNMSGGIQHGTAVNKGMNYSNSINMSGGVMASLGRAMYLSNDCTLSGGMIAGCGEPICASPNFLMTGGTIYGCNTNGIGIIYNNSNYAKLLGGTIETGFSSSAIYSNNAYINGVTFANNTKIIDANTTGTIIRSVNLEGTNTYFFYRTAGDGRAFGISLTGATNEFYQNSGYIYSKCITEILDYGGTVGAYKAWTRGGTATSQTSVMPSGYSMAYVIALQSNNLAFFYQYFVVPAGESRSIEVCLRKSVSMTVLPYVVMGYEIADVLSDNTVLDKFTMTNSTDTWETDTFVVDNTSGTQDLKYKLGFVAKNATGNVYAAYKITDTTPNSGGGGAVSIQPISGRLSL